MDNVKEQHSDQDLTSFLLEGQKGVASTIKGPNENQVGFAEAFLLMFPEAEEDVLTLVDNSKIEQGENRDILLPAFNMPGYMVWTYLKEFSKDLTVVAPELGTHLNLSADDIGTQITLFNNIAFNALNSVNFDDSNRPSNLAVIAGLAKAYTLSVEGAQKYGKDVGANVTTDKPSIQENKN